MTIQKPTSKFKLRVNEIAIEIIEKVTKKPASQTPQIWALYSEVLEYFDQGMKVPDDMTILLCDDNWGNVRRLPEFGAKKHLEATEFITMSICMVPQELING